MKRTKTVDKESEKAQQRSNSDIICPLTFKLVKLAVNYDCQFQSQTTLSVENDGEKTEVLGVWKSAPRVRGHWSQFETALEKMRENNEISWNEDAYYFTHEEGIEARHAYEQAVIRGEIKAHIKSWGPNPKMADDKSRFHKFTGVTYQELQEKYPELYGGKVKKIEKQAESPKEEIVAVSEDSKQEEVDPTVNELASIQEEEKVAAATTVEDTIEEINIQDEERDDHDVVVLYAPEGAEPQTVNDDAIGWISADGEEMKAYLFELPEIGTEIWLSKGRYNINGVTYDIRVEDDEA